MLLAAPDPELFDRAQWFAATTPRREQIARAVADQLAADFEYVGLRNYAGTDLEIAVLRHRSLDLLFSLVPGGSFEMGLSPEEEQAIIDGRPDDEDDEDDFNQEFDLLLSEMGTLRPLHTVRLPPFLIAQRVLNVATTRRFIDDFSDPLYGHTPDAPAHLSNEQGSLVLIGTDLRLPSEAELEYAARGHLSRTLLPTSTRIPDEDLLESMLADRADATSNAFGLHGYGLYPERCADAWLEHYKGAPSDGSPRLGPGPRVVRGGAANCYPWQGCGEWNVMLCAFRMSDHAAEFGSAIRLARSLAPLPHDHQPLTPSKPMPTNKKTTSKSSAKKQVKKAAKKVAAKVAAAAETVVTAVKKVAKAAAAKASAAKKRVKKAAKKVAKAASAKSTSAKKQVKKAAKKAGKKTASAKKQVKKAAKKAGKKVAKAASDTTAAAPKKTAKKTRKTGAKKTAKTAS